LALVYRLVGLEELEPAVPRVGPPKLLQVPLHSGVILEGALKISLLPMVAQPRMKQEGLIVLLEFVKQEASAMQALPLNLRLLIPLAAQILISNLSTRC